MKERFIRRVAFVALMVVTGALLGACGSGSDHASSEASSSARSGHPSGGAAAFLSPKGENNKLVRFGHEASGSTKKAAAAVLSRNLKAREAADFRTQCATLSAAATKEVFPVPSVKNAAAACPGSLGRIARPLKQTREVRTDTFKGQIDALRTEGNRAYALYHGKGGTDYAMPMVEEKGAWKVGSLVTLELGPTHLRG